MDGNAYSRLVEAAEEALLDSARKLGYGEDAKPSLERSKMYGEFSSAIALKLAKRLKRNPMEIAEAIASGMKLPEGIGKVSTENGFINLHVDRAKFAASVLEETQKGRGEAVASHEGDGKHIIIEYPSVNPNKPWHVGHLRNAVLGDCLANLYANSGYSVSRQDYIDDMGLQMVISIWGVMNLGHVPDKRYDFWLGEEYVEANRIVEEKGMKEDISRLTAQIEQEGTYESKFAREVAAKCVMAQYQTAFDYGMYHDVLVWESDIIREKLLEKAVALLKERGFAKVEAEGKYSGCLVVNFSDIKDLPPELAGMKENVKVLLRSDGSPTYVAKDIAFHMWKFGLLENTFKFSTFIERQPNGRKLLTTAEDGDRIEFRSADRAINVIATEQSFPQLLVRLAFKGIGRPEIYDRLYHLSYGRVTLEEGSLAGRKGGGKEYNAKRLLDIAEERASALIGSRFEIGEEEKKKIAHDVALAAIKFEFLRISPEKEIVFSWERAMNFEGGSGPYSQYMHARAARILSSAGERSATPDYGALEKEHDFRMVMLLAQAGQVAQKACAENRPNVVCDYLNELSSEFSSFYEASPVLKAEDGTREARLRLVQAFADVQESMLALLGIPCPERM